MRDLPRAPRRSPRQRVVAATGRWPPPGQEIEHIWENADMLYTIVVVMIILWLLGLVTSYTMGGLIHILLVIALIVVVVQLLQGRRI